MGDITSGLNPLIYEEWDFLIKINLIPRDKKEESEDNFKRVIGMWPMQFFTGSGQDSINKIIEKKSKKYKNIGLPFLICVNSLLIELNSHVSFP